MIKGFSIKKLYLYIALNIIIVFLSIATFIGDLGVVGGFGVSFAAINIRIFGYVAYLYLPLLLYPMYRFYKDSRLTFRRLELISASCLFFVALLILQSLLLQKGDFANSLILFLKDYIGILGVWILDIFFFCFAWLISTKRNIDLLMRQTKHRIFIVFDIIKHFARVLFTRSKELYKRIKAFLSVRIHSLFGQDKQPILDIQIPQREQTVNAHYDFKDVLIEEAFDEMHKRHSTQATNTPLADTLNMQDAQKPTHTLESTADSIKAHTFSAQSHTESTAIHTTIATNDTQPTTFIASDSTHKSNGNDNSNNGTSISTAAIADTSTDISSVSTPRIEIVQTPKQDVSIEDFFKNQVAAHKDMLQNLRQHTAFSEPVFTKPTLIETDSQSTKPILKTNDIPQSQPHTQSPQVKTISTPPSRPLNPSAFLSVEKPTLDSALDYKIDSMRQNVENENIKAAQHFAAHPSLSSSQQQISTQNAQNISHNTHNATLAQKPTQNHKQHTAEPFLAPSIDTNKAKEPTTLTQPKDTKAHTAKPSKAVLELDIQEISTESDTKEQWIDSVVQEIKEVKNDKSAETPLVKTADTAHARDITQDANTSKTYAHTRVRKLEESESLLDELEYGKVAQPTHFKLPPVSLLDKPLDDKIDIDDGEIDRKIENLLSKLKTFRVDGDVVRTYPGPIVTTFEFRPAPHVKVSTILRLENDLALALSARSIRIQAPIPGKDVVGIEIPNNSIQTIYLREILESDRFKTAISPLTLAIGKDIVGYPFITDLKKAPHLLIAGTTGSGKSVGLNAMILSLLYKNAPSELKLLMIDPKRVEFSIYADIPHLIAPIITQPKKAITALNSAVSEMERRLDLMSDVHVRDIDSYNAKMRSEGKAHFPYFVIIIDELADLMMTGGKEVEYALTRVAQMGRASGIHIIVATQRPSVDVVTGMIKANLPSRISYKVGTKVDSKVILDAFGAESLLGRGDMLFKLSDSSIMRFHAPFSTEEEIKKVTDFIKAQQSANYDKDFLVEERDELISLDRDIGGGESDLLQKAKNAILNEPKKISISLIQRRLSIGFNKATTLIEQLEKEGFISKPNGQGKRELLG